MKKILSTVIIIGLLLTAFAFSSSAVEFELVDTDSVLYNNVLYYRYTKNDYCMYDEYTVVGFDVTSDAPVEINIEKEIKGYPVTSIAIEEHTPKEKGYDKIVSVKIPDSVTKIGSYSFSQLSSVKELVLPQSINKIGYYAFYGMDSLEKINIPKQIKVISMYTFTDCENLKEVTFDGDLERISDNAFVNCKSLTSINLPSTLTDIYSGAFAYSGLKSITIPANCVAGDHAFEGCENLEKVTFNGKSAMATEGLFNNCKALKDIYILQKLMNPFA